MGLSQVSESCGSVPSKSAIYGNVGVLGLYLCANPGKQDWLLPKRGQR